jgi:hypothetical protein
VAASVNEPSLTRALKDLIEMLESQHFSYALGGALAFSVWAVPRATADIDLNIWCSPDRIEETVGLLYAAGVGGPEKGIAIKQAEEDGVAYVSWQGIRLDVFVPSIPFYDEAYRTRVRAEVPDIGAAWVLSKEALCVFKMLFFRLKDILDVEKLIAVQREDLDSDFVVTQLAEMLGEEDERVLKFKSLIAEAHR